MTAPVPASAVFEHIADLEAYAAWMPLIHHVESLAADAAASAHPAWDVELRAQVGPFARSKRLRMERTEHHPDRSAVFERSEDDGRRHSQWLLRAELAEAGGSTELTMTLRYDGSLWAGPVLERVLDDQVRRGSERLAALLVSGSGTPG